MNPASSYIPRRKWLLHFYIKAIACYCNYGMIFRRFYIRVVGRFLAAILKLVRVPSRQLNGKFGKKLVLK